MRAASSPAIYSLSSEDTAKALETTAGEEAEKPIGLAEISPTAEAMKEIASRLAKLSEIIAHPPHDVPSAIITAAGLMMNAIGMSSDIIGSMYTDNPAVDALKAIGTAGSLAFIINEARKRPSVLGRV